MAINTGGNLLQGGDIAINAGSRNKFTGVFAGIGNFAGISVGGGGGAVGTGGGGSAPPIVIAGAGEGGSDLIAFDPMIDEARPGDLITADFMKRLLHRINVLEAAVLELASGGEVVVPHLFGQQLSAVRTAVNQSAGKLTFGLVLDVFGNEVNPQQASQGERVVLGQYPVPGAEVDEGTELNILVTSIFDFNNPSAAFEFTRDAAAAAKAPAPADGELQRVTDEATPPAAGGASKGASKSRKSAAK